MGWCSFWNNLFPRESSRTISFLTFEKFLSHFSLSYCCFLSLFLSSVGVKVKKLFSGIYECWFPLFAFDLGVLGGSDGGVADKCLWVLGAKSLRVTTLWTGGNSKTSSDLFLSGLKEKFGDSWLCLSWRATLLEISYLRSTDSKCSSR